MVRLWNSVKKNHSMSKSFETYQKRKLKGSYLSVVLSMTLVLFILGAFSLVVLKSSTITAYFKEQMPVNIYLKNDVDSKKISSFIKYLNEESFTSRTTFTSKEKAAEQFEAELGEDFMDFLGENPLKNNVDLYLKSNFVNTLSMDQIVSDLQSNAYVFEVQYNRSLVELMNENIRQISLYVLILVGFFTFISVILINSSLRLSVYSKRFTIKTMQMVGATKRFIRRPFILQNLRLALIAALLACMILGLGIYYLDQAIPSLKLIEEKRILIYDLGIVIGSGIVISSVSTFLATTRFLNLRTEELYY